MAPGGVVPGPDFSGVLAAAPALLHGRLGRALYFDGATQVSECGGVGWDGVVQGGVGRGGVGQGGLGQGGVGQGGVGLGGAAWGKGRGVRAVVQGGVGQGSMGQGGVGLGGMGQGGVGQGGMGQGGVGQGGMGRGGMVQGGMGLGVVRHRAGWGKAGGWVGGGMSGSAGVWRRLVRLTHRESLKHSEVRVQLRKT